MIDALISLTILLYAVRKMMNMPAMTAIDFTIVSFGFTYGLVPLINSRLGGGLQFPDIITVQYGIGVLLFILGMYFVSFFSPFKKLKELTEIVPPDAKMLFVTFLAVVGLRLVLALGYGSAFSGLSNDPESQTGYFQVFYSMESILSCALWVLLARCVFSKKSFFLETLLALEFIFVFCKGRRTILVFFCILVVFCRFSKRWINRGLYEYIGIAIVITAFILLSIVYQPFRMELVREKDAHKSPSLSQAAAGILVSDPGDVIMEDSKNVKERDLIYMFHKRIIQAHEGKSPMLGDALFSAFVVVAPGFLYPDKYDVANSKGAIQRYYGMSSLDTAGSMAAIGQADFGLLGTFLYGCLFALILKFFEKISSKFKGSLIGISSLGALFLAAGNVEQGPEELFSMIRNLAIFAVLIIVVRFIMPMRSSHDQFST
jgi:hypothetical protein